VKIKSLYFEQSGEGAVQPTGRREVPRQSAGQRATRITMIRAGKPGFRRTHVARAI
jgi:hypothetical protein